MLVIRRHIAWSWGSLGEWPGYPPCALESWLNLANTSASWAIGRWIFFWGVRQCWASFGSLAMAFSPVPVEDKALSGRHQEAQERPFLDGSGRQPWLLTIACSPSWTRKIRIARRFCLFAMAFSLYLSRKRQFQSSAGPNSTYLLTVGLGGGLNPN